MNSKRAVGKNYAEGVIYRTTTGYEIQNIRRRIRGRRIIRIGAESKIGSDRLTLIRFFLGWRFRIFVVFGRRIRG